MKILVVEDEPRLGEQILETLENNGWVPELSQDGIDALYRATSEEWDAIVLDLGLPKLDGLTVLKGIRDENINTPVVILSARDTLSQRVEGLNAGADDYLTKPFEMVELTARLRAQLRRASGNASPVMQIGDLSLDTRSSKVLWQGQAVSLTALEYKVVAYFMHNPEKLFPVPSWSSTSISKISTATQTPLKCSSVVFVRKSHRKSSRPFVAWGIN